MIFSQLYVSFLKIGFTSFGGLSMVPLIMEEMESHGWMSAEDVSNLVAIAEMTPGPMGVNCATFAGLQSAGLPGLLAALAGVLTPAFTLTLFVGIFYAKFCGSPVFSRVLIFVRPICVALIGSVLVKLVRTNLFGGGSIDLAGVFIAVVMFWLMLKRKWRVYLVIPCAAVLGIIFYVFLGLS